MIVTLVGMSGSGKSYWSKRLAYEQGFRNYYCDDLIEQKLRRRVPELGNGIGAVANWLKFPDAHGFAERERMYLDAEIEVMGEVLSSVALTNSSAERRNVVIDTSGSVVYTGENVCRALREQTTILYLKIPAGEQKDLLEQFLRDPKPVLWQQHYHPMPDESVLDALKRCYPDLLQDRSHRYEQLAHQVLEVPIAERANQQLTQLLATLTEEK